MSWLLNLYKTYENNLEHVGEIQRKYNGQEYALLPVAHTTQHAQIEVTITESGDFHSAKVISKDDANTIIPCTEGSFSRTSKPVPHPLHDNLIYVAGDYVKYGGVYKNGQNLYDLYMTQLLEFAQSEYAHPKVKIIHKYLSKSSLITDLILESIVHVNRSGNFISKWSKQVQEEYGDKPELFKVLSDTQEKATVRFNVHFGDEKITDKVWNDKDVHDSFVNFYNSKLSEDEYCYISGLNRPKTEKHSSKIRHAADMSKLISANDSTGFTYRGRFSQDSEAANICYDVSQKAHNALKWLIQKQGRVIDGRVFLVWGNEEAKVASPHDDFYSLLNELGKEEEEPNKEQDQTHETYAKKVTLAMAGYKKDLTYQSDNINILILDAATPGRMAVVYYRNLDKEQYIHNIEHWHQTSSWLHKYRKDEDKKMIPFPGAPSLKDIANIAYGRNASDKLIKQVIERLYPCVIDRAKLPPDIMRNAYFKAINPVALEYWEWEKTLSITCSLIKKHYEKEEYDVALEIENTERDYLFGRLLAVADVLEKRALTNNDSQRVTNAQRYMNAFAKHPTRTWDIIQSNLQPYQARLGAKGGYLTSMIDEIASKMNTSDFTNKTLTPVFLLGFYSQRHELYQGKKQSKGDEENGSTSEQD
ncbi:type I-C CRISPR-associated protein Cas8c/Csd1 [Bacillus sp. 2205SS5-2]|uniref:type I-C CRISPR-associated protein Cas8c/Csd1 n=1 Tax=Bacillus sp. 2205SS5-2 TaxID=3109031 RepID=UPI003004D0DA